MDSHNVGRGRSSVKEALGLVQANTLVIGIKNDLLFPIEEQQFLARNIPNAQFLEIDSFYGHDGLLLETKTLSQNIGAFIKKDTTKAENKILKIA